MYFENLEHIVESLETDESTKNDPIGLKGALEPLMHFP